jgi:hypothetical protein
MFQKPTGEVYAKAYRIPVISLAGILTDDNLWTLPHPEYTALKYPDMVLSIIEIEVTITYQGIKGILNSHNIPTDLGFLLYALAELKLQNLISEITPKTYTAKQKL